MIGHNVDDCICLFIKLPVTPWYGVTGWYPQLNVVALPILRVDQTPSSTT